MQPPRVCPAPTIPCHRLPAAALPQACLMDSLSSCDWELWRLPGSVQIWLLAVQAGRAAELEKGLPFVISFDPRFDTWNFSGVRFENSRVAGGSYSL